MKIAVDIGWWSFTLWTGPHNTDTADQPERGPGSHCADLQPAPAEDGGYSYEEHARIGFTA